LVSADESDKIAIIPGVIPGQDEHSFLQILNGTGGINHLRFILIGVFSGI
jgi:hypothetical protein